MPLLVGNPLPLHGTSVDGVKLQPEIAKLTGLIRSNCSLETGVTSEIASGILLAQSPAHVNGRRTAAWVVERWSRSGSGKYFHAVALPLVAAEIKQFLFDDGAAAGTAELLQVSGFLGPRC